jgi:hypothetical protein
LRVTQANARELRRATQLMTRRSRLALAAGGLDQPKSFRIIRTANPGAPRRAAAIDACQVLLMVSFVAGDMPEKQRATVRVRLPDGCMLEVSATVSFAATAVLTLQCYRDAHGASELGPVTCPGTIRAARDSIGAAQIRGRSVGRTTSRMCAL